VKRCTRSALSSSISSIGDRPSGPGSPHLRIGLVPVLETLKARAAEPGEPRIQSAPEIAAH
jgi:hypothetical protein